MSETADERTDVSGRTWCATYTSLRLLFYTETIGTLYYRSNKRVSTLRTISECRQKECPKETIGCPDNKDNKDRKNNEVQSTMVTTVMTVYCTAIDKIRYTGNCYR